MCEAIADRARLLQLLQDPYLDANNCPIWNWNVASVVDMHELFNDAPNVTNRSFPYAISAWDVSSVTNMNNMFRGVTDFIDDISCWDVSSVTIFGEYGSFWDYANLGPHPVGLHWCANVAYMTMLRNWVDPVSPNGEWDRPFTDGRIRCYDANIINDLPFGCRPPLCEVQTRTILLQHINNTDGSPVVDTSGCPLEFFDTSTITDMNSVFRYVNPKIFTYPLWFWDVSSVTNMAFMFYDNSNLGTHFPSEQSPLGLECWDVRNVVQFARMFDGSGMPPAQGYYLCQNEYYDVDIINCDSSICRANSAPLGDLTRTLPPLRAHIVPDDKEPYRTPLIIVSVILGLSLIYIVWSKWRERSPSTYKRVDMLDMSNTDENSNLQREHRQIRYAGKLV